MKYFLLLSLLFSNLVFSKTITLTEDNSISFNDKFSGMFVAQKQIEAANKCYRNVGSDIYVVLYTPGGSVQAGQLLFDTLNALPCNFHTITIFAASMGYQTVQNLKSRLILPSGILMSHRAYLSGLSGEIGGELNKILKLYEDNIRELNTIASNRVGISLEKYENLIADELWLTGNEAVKSNHADEVVLVNCDKSVSGTYKRVVNTFFGSIEVEFSKCPLITAPVGISSSNTEAIDYIVDRFTNIAKHVKLEL